MMTYANVFKVNQKLVATSTDAPLRVIEFWKPVRERRWVRDPEGNLGYLAKSRTDAFLIYYPYKEDYKGIHCIVKSFPAERWKEMEGVRV